jgi:hypothetical protein
MNKKLIETIEVASLAFIFCISVFSLTGISL